MQLRYGFPVYPFGIHGTVADVLQAQNVQLGKLISDRIDEARQVLAMVLRV